MTKINKITIHVKDDKEKHSSYSIKYVGKNTFVFYINKNKLTRETLERVLLLSGLEYNIELKFHLDKVSIKLKNKNDLYKFKILIQSFKPDYNISFNERHVKRFFG